MTTLYSCITFAFDLISLALSLAIVKRERLHAPCRAHNPQPCALELIAILRVITP